MTLIPDQDFFFNLLLAIFRNSFMAIECSLVCNSGTEELFDGNSLNWRSVGKFCGHNQLFPIPSSGRWLTINFRTTSYNQDKGFKLHYNFTTPVIRKY